MRRFAVAIAGLALVAAAQAPAAAAAAARSVAAPRATAAAKPSPKPSPKKPAKPSPAPRPAHPAVPAAPTATTVEPRPTAQCPPQGQTVSAHVTGVPWAQQALDFSGVWPLTQGQGVTVAVVDSGVDYTPQLSGRLSAIDLTGTGTGDCVGHGTAIAAIIAASDMQSAGVPFEGVAPGAKILSIKVQNGETGNPFTLAQGIRDAALLKAGVINVSITTRNNPQLASAVAFALKAGSVIVAAGGNDDQQTGVGPFYPASYPGVLSVGAVASDGSLGPFSDQRSHVAVTAPGVGVTSAYPGSGYQVSDLDGTSYATAFVSGVAALLRARYPRLSNAAVVQRIEQTANGNAGPGTGDGLVNPLQALTAIVPPRAAQSPSPAARPQPVSVYRAPRPDRAVIDTALEATAGALGAAAVVAVGALVIRQGRRRRWRAG